jgi:hypothetical protein
MPRLQTGGFDWGVARPSPTPSPPTQPAHPPVVHAAVCSSTRRTASLPPHTVMLLVGPPAQGPRNGLRSARLHRGGTCSCRRTSTERSVACEAHMACMRAMLLLWAVGNRRGAGRPKSGAGNDVATAAAASSHPHPPPPAPHTTRFNPPTPGGSRNPPCKAQILPTGGHVLRACALYERTRRLIGCEAAAALRAGRVPQRRRQPRTALQEFGLLWLYIYRCCMAQVLQRGPIGRRPSGRGRAPSWPRGAGGMQLGRGRTAAPSQGAARDKAGARGRDQCAARGGRAGECIAACIEALWQGVARHHRRAAAHAGGITGRPAAAPGAFPRWRRRWPLRRRGGARV